LCSQLFWGNLIAGRGLGPIPIPYKSLTAQNLANAIEFCLTPSAQAAAHDVARQMRDESGVSTAVAAFHRNLPLDRMRCHLLTSEPAIWKVKKASKPSLHLSRIAAEVLVGHHRLKAGDLEL
jgi:hypothetical protein